MGSLSQQEAHTAAEGVHDRGESGTKEKGTEATGGRVDVDKKRMAQTDHPGVETQAPPIPRGEESSGV